MRRRNDGLRGAVRPVLFAGLLAAVVLVFFTALHSLESGQGEAGREQLEESLRRTCVACYAAEGMYPPTLEYMEEHYGLLVDTERYDVFYQAVAENLMPDITVIEKVP